VSAVRHLVAHCRAVSIVAWHPTLPCRLPTSRPRLRALCPGALRGPQRDDDGASPHAAAPCETRARVETPASRRPSPGRLCSTTPCTVGPLWPTADSLPAKTMCDDWMRRATPWTMYILLTIICKHGAAANKTGSANQRGEKKFEGFFYLQNRNTAAD
jgi:hypothetical protein